MKADSERWIKKLQYISFRKWVKEKTKRDIIKWLLGKKGIMHVKNIWIYIIKDTSFVLTTTSILLSYSLFIKNILKTYSYPFIPLIKGPDFSSFQLQITNKYLMCYLAITFRSKRILWGESARCTIPCLFIYCKPWRTSNAMHKTFEELQKNTKCHRSITKSIQNLF